LESGKTPGAIARGRAPLGSFAPRRLNEGREGPAARIVQGALAAMTGSEEFRGLYESLIMRQHDASKGKQALVAAAP